MDIDTQAQVKDIRWESGPALSFLGNRIAYLEDPADNGDACLLYEGRTPSGGMIPPHREDNHEAFYILEGEFQLDVEGVAYRRTVGDFLRIAPGVLHSLTNVGPGWGRILFMVSPGSQHQRFFDTLGTPLEPHQDPHPLTKPPDFPAIAAAGEASGIDFASPPNGA
jgi:quercetin dioxygenase-like cupin family protein